MICYKALFLLILVSSSISAHAQNEKSVALFGTMGLPIGEMHQSRYISGYGAGIRYEWAESKLTDLAFSVSMIGWSHKKLERVQADTVAFDDMGSSAMTVSIPVELALKFKFTRNQLIPRVFLAFGLYFSDGSESDDLVPGLGAYIAPGISMLIPFTTAHAVEARVKSVFGTSTAIDVSCISLDLGIAFTL